MKNFFTLFSFLFLGVVVAILVAGYISKDNRLAREAYSKKTQEQLIQIASSVESSQKQIDSLEEKFNESQSVQTSTTAGSKKTITTKSQTPSKAKPTTPGTKLTSELVAKHSTASDCWIIVSQKVYSVSSYISEHPGGKSVIVKMCGKDATTVFTSRGDTGEHSSTAWQLLGQFLVGSLGSTVTL